MINISVNNIMNSINKKSETAKKQLIKEIIKDTTPLVPMDTGNLRESVKETNDGVEWTADYARDVYYSDYPHKVGTSEWFEHAKQMYMTKWLNNFKQNMR